MQRVAAVAEASRPRQALFRPAHPPLLCRYHYGDVREQLLSIVDDPVLHGVADAADPLQLLGLLVQPQRPCTVERLEVLKRVFSNDHEVGKLPHPNHPDWRFGDSFGLVKRLRAIHRCSADHLVRIEARFLQHLQLLGEPEAVRFKDEATVSPGSHPAADILIVI